jgi:hypothetical protein
MRDAKVLLYDVEVGPNIAYIWGKYEQDALGDFIQERQVISFAWKWLGEKDVHVLSLPRFKEYKKDRNSNRSLIMRLHELFVRADIVIGHNVDKFDDKMANTEFILNGLNPPPPHKTIDTLKVARSRFRFNSNKLDDLGIRLGVGRKVKTGGFKLWAGCLNGDMKSWSLMEGYNKQDVILLEKVYLKLRPWIKNHPDLNAIDRHVGCPACKGINLNRRGWERVGTGRRRRYQCNDCGKWARGTIHKNGEEERYS